MTCLKGITKENIRIPPNNNSQSLFYLACLQHLTRVSSSPPVHEWLPALPHLPHLLLPRWVTLPSLLCWFLPNLLATWYGSALRLSPWAFSLSEEKIKYKIWVCSQGIHPVSKLFVPSIPWQVPNSYFLPCAPDSHTHWSPAPPPESLINISDLKCPNRLLS